MNKLKGIERRTFITTFLITDGRYVCLTLIEASSYGRTDSENTFVVGLRAAIVCSAMSPTLKCHSRLHFVKTIAPITGVAADTPVSSAFLRRGHSPDEKQHPAKGFINPGYVITFSRCLTMQLSAPQPRKTSLTLSTCGQERQPLQMHQNYFLE